MPSINGITTEDTGSVFTSFTGSANIITQTFTFASEQNGMRFRNKGTSAMTVTINGKAHKIPPNAVIEIDDDSFDSFDAVTTYGTHAFEGRSYTRKGVSSGVDAYARAQLAEIAKPIEAKKVLALSESIFQVSDFMTSFKSKFSTQPETVEGLYGGSHISTALAEMADEIYIPQVGENALKFSNDILAGSPWVINPTVTITKEYLKDGTKWHKAIKNDNTAYQGFYQNFLAYPLNAKGVFVSFEVYIPSSATPSPMTNLGVLLNNTNLGGAAQKVKKVSGLIAGKKYKIVVWFDKSELTWNAGSGENIQMYVTMNDGAPTNHSACTAYFRNFELSFFAPLAYQKYIPTGANAESAGATEWSVEQHHPFIYRDVDATIISFGRNEANDIGDGYSHFRAYDKLISTLLSRGSTVIPGNPPPRYDTTTGNWHGSDQYKMYLDNHWKRLVAKWNVGIDVNQSFRDLVSTGEYTPTQLMMDSWHESALGADLMAQWYAEKIDKRKLINNALPELTGKIKYYVKGIPTGTWSINSVTAGVDANLLGINTVITSSTQNDFLSFTVESAEQLHVLYRQDSTTGTIDVIVDEGTGKERKFSLNTSASVGDRLHGHFLCDFLEEGTHTVKIVVTSSGKPVKVHGIVAI